MKYRIRFTLGNSREATTQKSPYVNIAHSNYVAGTCYDVSAEVAIEMLSLNGFRPFDDNIQTAVDVYHKMYGLLL